MNRWTLWLMAVGLLLCGCGGQQSEANSPRTEGICAELCAKQGLCQPFVHTSLGKGCCDRQGDRCVWFTEGGAIAMAPVDGESLSTVDDFLGDDDDDDLLGDDDDDDGDDDDDHVDCFGAAFDPREAARGFVPHVEKIAEICERSRYDCAKMGVELTEYAAAHAKAIRRSFGCAGGLPAVRDEMDDLGDEFDEDTEIILEAGEMSCAEKDKAVARALIRLMLMDE